MNDALSVEYGIKYKVQSITLITFPKKIWVQFGTFSLRHNIRILGI